MDKKIIKREIFSKIIQHLAKPEITLILGPRQSGKTTLLLSLKDYLIQKKAVSPNRIRFFNLDIIDDFRFFEDQSFLIQLIKRETTGGQKLYIFVDEAQRIKNAGLFLKGIYDTQLPVKFIITGSSALEIKAKIHEPLTGRKRIFLLTTFSFPEFLQARAPELLPLLKTASLLTYPEHQQLKQIYISHLVTGGYPRAVLADSTTEEEEYLKEIFNSYIEKDIIGFLGYQDRASFASLLTLLASQIGSLVNINELSRSIGIARATVERYLEALEATFITSVSRPYFTNLRKTIRKMPKIFFLDHGLRNIALKSFHHWSERTDQGALLEESVAIILWKNYSTLLFFFRTTNGSEVDFILEKGGKRYLIESKLKSANQFELNRLKKIAHLLKAQKILLVTLDLSEPKKIIKSEIPLIYCQPWTLLQQLEN